MSKESYIPVSELSDTEADRLIWRVDLPAYAPSDEIGVNVRRLDNLARIGGFEVLIVDSYSGDTTTYNYDISSVGSDGSATASKSASVVAAETQKTTVDEVPSRRTRLDEYTWTKGSVSLNSSEIDKRVDENGRHVRDPEAWSKELNKALSQGIRSATYKNLVTRPTTADKNLGLVQLSGITVISLVTSKNGLDFPVEEIKYLAGYQFLLQPLFDQMLFRQSIKERRWSISPTVQFDRLAAVHGITRALPLVKNLKDKSK